MACFIVPATEAVVTTILTKTVKSKEKEPETLSITNEFGSVEEYEKTPFSRKLHWLSNLLWGGSALLAFEHLWHGEVTPWFPFLTNAANPAGILREMATTGVSMAVLVTLVWCGMLAISAAMEKRAAKTAEADMARETT